MRRITVVLAILLLVLVVACDNGDDNGASDNEGNNTAPDIVSSPVTSAKSGEKYTYAVQAVDVGDTMTFTLEQAPTGMTINSSTGVIEWTPDSPPGTEVQVTVKVSDVSGQSDTQSFTITCAAEGETDPVNKYAVIYGISDYLDPGVGDLTYCDEDANSWYLYLSSLGYDCEVYGHLKASDYSLYSGTATEYNVSLAVRDMVSKADSNDYVAFIASGHGMYGDDLNEAALLMHDYGSPEGGMDGAYWDTELEDDFSDCVAAQTFIFVDSCFADAMGEVFTGPKSGHVMMVASCMGDPDSESWDYPQHSHGAWTYYFLRKGLQDASHASFDLSQIFYWAKDQYKVFYTDPVIGLGYDEIYWNNLDQPVLHDSDPGTPMNL